ncbi:MAG: hypothetical protein HYS56_04630 [Candidatus Omnitrophica bacterium]|nr:hypothetical protein [Candidatus Omnitrophota bacterium]
MTEEQIDRRIHLWQKRLHLEDFEIHWNIFPAKTVPELEDGSPACVHVAQSDRKIFISFAKEQAHAIDEELIVHELSHAFLTRLDEFSTHVIDTYVPDRKARSLIILQKDDLENEIVDWLTRVFLKLDGTTQKTKRSRGNKKRKERSGL